MERRDPLTLLVYRSEIGVQRDTMTAKAALLFYGFDESQFSGGGRLIRKIRNRFQGGSIVVPAPHELICHAHNSRGIEAAAQLSPDGTSGPEPCPNRLAKQQPKLNLAFPCVATTQLRRREIPQTARRLEASARPGDAVCRQDRGDILVRRDSGRQRRSEVNDDEAGIHPV